ncbi:unnamed protein product [Pleuronectes platessa]|uniref:Uncharacterized protein n=1 Tax=Pleuronectes platessa TaxID=8262 RepID=A0A9N7VGA2_PLEPL|nr:unnamed protein product [Pleuronectes platessa]
MIAVGVDEVLHLQPLLAHSVYLACILGIPLPVGTAAAEGLFCRTVHHLPPSDQKAVMHTTLTPVTHWFAGPGSVKSHPTRPHLLCDLTHPSEFAGSLLLWLCITVAPCLPPCFFHTLSQEQTGPRAAASAHRQTQTSHRSGQRGSGFVGEALGAEPQEVKRLSVVLAAYVSLILTSPAATEA